MNARKARKEDPITKLKVSQSQGQCEATTGEWGDPGAKRCQRKMDGVFIDDMGRYVVLCRECRIMALGYTSGERKQMRDAFKGAQMPMFLDQKERKDYGGND